MKIFFFNKTVNYRLKLLLLSRIYAAEKGREINIIFLFLEEKNRQNLLRKGLKSILYNSRRRVVGDL